MKYFPLFLICLLGTTTPVEVKQLVKVQKLIQSEKMWDGTTLPAYPEGQPEITVAKITIPPRSTLAWHKHPSINAGYLLSGALTVISEDGKQLTLNPGDALIELVNKYHYGRNDGNVAAEIVVFYAGKQGIALSNAR